MNSVEYQMSIGSARALHLAAQGLLAAPHKKAKKDDLLACIKQMAALQIDTINIVARSPYLVLWSRLGQYDISWLDELLKEKKLFEYWSHEACFLPIEDFGLYRHQMISPHGLGWKYNQRWLNENTHEVEKIKQYIQQYGACRSADFERTDGKSGGWWEWKPEKRALELLFTTGELMVAERQKFQRVYDLRERVHPDWNDAIHLEQNLDCQRKLVLKAIRALGICKANWVSDYFRMGKLDPSNHPETLTKQGLVIKAQVKGWDQICYVHPDNATLAEQASKNELKATATRILSPFDPVVWDRKRAMELFGFDYKLECYTPHHKRQYGYFTLPIMRKGALIGRMDAKAHRKEKFFEIKSLHFEPTTRISNTLVADINKTINEFSHWHGCNEVRITSASHRNFLPS